MAPPTKKPAGDRVLRPPNAFILYRSEMQPKLVAENKGGGRSSRDWSGIVGQMWKNEDPVVKAKYHEMARSRLLEHKQKYPDYKYAPGRKKAKEAAAAKEAMAKPAAKKGSKRKRNYEEDDFEEEDEPSDLEDDSDVAHAFVGSGSGGAHTNASWAAAPSNHTQPPPSSDRRFSSSSSSKTSASRSMVMGPPAPMPGAGLAAVAPSISHAPEQHANFVKIRRLNGTHVMVVTKPPTNCSVFQPTPIASPLRSSSNPMIPPHSARLTSGPEAYARLKAGMQRLKSNFYNSLLRLASNKAPLQPSLLPLTLPKQPSQPLPCQRQQRSPLYLSPLSMTPILPPAQVAAPPVAPTQRIPVQPIHHPPSTPLFPQVARPTFHTTPRPRFQVRLKLPCKVPSCGPPAPQFESAVQFHAHLAERHGAVARVVDAEGAPVEVARDAADGKFHCLCCVFRSWDVVEFEEHMLACAEKDELESVQVVEVPKGGLGGTAPDEV
ncbi:hypothetical protein BC830DRAFT_55488 [Chytriomyces sp. MP71]|nr:hypothetical protein BC830DRAFT_55488 [Chytriomyces sp. MP71]